MSKLKELLTMTFTGLIALVLISACTSSEPRQKFTLRVGIFPVLDALPYFVMKERELAEKYGIAFEESAYPGGAAVLDALSAGKADVGPTIGTVPVLTAAERGMIPDKIIPAAANDFADPEHPGMAVLADNSINGWRDLDGKQIAVNAKNSITAAALIGRLKREGVRNCTLVEIEFPNMGLAVAGGNVAAAGLMEPFLSQSLLRGDGKLLDWVIGGPPFERFEYTMVVFNADIYRKRPAAVKAFLRAYLKAVSWIRQHPDEARLILGRALNLNPDVTRQIKLLRFTSDGRNDPALLESMQPLLIDIGMLKKRIPAGQLYDEKLLGEVLSERR